MQEVCVNIIEQLEEKANIEGFDFEEYEYEIKMQCYHDAIEIVKQEAEKYNNGLDAYNMYKDIKDSEV